MAELLQGVGVAERNTRKITIYECKNCRGVLGNSDYLMPDCEDVKFIYLTDVENALMTTKLMCSTDVKDKHCTFHNLECQNCRMEVGIHYSTVTDALKHLNNNYRLSIASICSVQTMIAHEDQNNVANAEMLATITEHSRKIDDIAVMLVEALLDRTHIKDSVTIHANLIGVLKKEIDELKENNSN